MTKDFHARPNQRRFVSGPDPDTLRVFGILVSIPSDQTVQEPSVPQLSDSSRDPGLKYQALFRFLYIRYVFMKICWSLEGDNITQKSFHPLVSKSSSKKEIKLPTKLAATSRSLGDQNF